MGTNRLTEQLSLPGFDPAPPRRPPQRKNFAQRPEALFFAARPDPDSATCIERQALHTLDKYKLTAKLRPKVLFHISMQYLGDPAELPDDVRIAACEAAATVSMPPFDVALDRVMSFGKPLVLCGGDGVAGLTMLYRALGAALAGVGLGEATSDQYTPHLTLLYDESKTRIDEPTIGRIAWKVTEFVLLHSLVGRSRHDVVMRWPLGLA